MLKNGFQYGVEIYKSDGSLLGQIAISPDWDPAFECTCFEGVRSVRLDPAVTAQRGEVEPLWHEEKGQPYVHGFRIRVSTPSLEPVCEEFPSSYFRNAAEKAARGFIESGQLTKGEVFHFLATAFARSGVDPSPMSGRTVIEDDELREPWPIIEGSKLQTEGAIATSSSDAAVFVPNSVLDDVAALSRTAGPVETGGVLLGHLLRDPATREVFVVITGHVPGQGMIAEPTKLTFTADTWTHARQIVNLRGRGEIMLGWWHSHVGREVCKNCAVERQRVCEFSHGFFSTHDCHFQRTAFSRAYQIGLVVNDPAEGEVTFSLFGWRKGLIEARSFHVTGLMEIPINVDMTTAIDKGEPHVTNTQAC